MITIKLLVMNNMLNNFRKSEIYDKFYAFCLAKHNYPIGILDTKHFSVVVGFLIDFAYNQGFEVIASHRGYKITQHRKGKLMVIEGSLPDAYNNTIYMHQIASTTLNNYEHGFSILFRALNTINEPF